MRYTPDDPAFAGDFIEYSDSWSRAQVRAAWDAIPSTVAEAVDSSEDKLLAVLRPKIVALHLTCVDAEPITSADDLTPERTEQMDTRLYGWFGNVWVVHLRELSRLGEALGRQLWPTSVTSKATTTRKQPTAPSRKSRKS